MTFHGWTDAILDFFDGLEVDNSKSYWQTHKKVYDEEVRGPMQELLSELTDEFGEPKIFRPNRDIGSAPTRPLTRRRSVPLLPAMGTCSSRRRGSPWPAAHTPSRQTSWSATAAQWPWTCQGKPWRRWSTTPARSG